MHRWMTEFVVAGVEVVGRSGTASRTRQCQALRRQPLSMLIRIDSVYEQCWGTE